MPRSWRSTRPATGCTTTGCTISSPRRRSSSNEGGDLPRRRHRRRRRPRAQARGGAGPGQDAGLRHLRLRPACRPARARAWSTCPGASPAASPWICRATSCSATSSAARCWTTVPTRSAACSPARVPSSMPVMPLSAELRTTIGYSNEFPGGYAERMVLAAPLLLEVPNGLPAEHAALTEPLAVGIHAVEKAALARDDVALVVGCGPVGLAAIVGLQAEGRPADHRRRLLTQAARARRQDGGRHRDRSGQGDALRQAARRPPRGDFRVRRRARPAAADLRSRTARRPHRRRRRLHGARPHRAVLRNRQGARPAVRARLHARGVRLVPFACWPKGRSTAEALDHRQGRARWGEGRLQSSPTPSATPRFGRTMAFGHLPLPARGRG